MYNLLIEILKVGGIAALALVIVFFLLKDSVLTATPRKFTHASGYFEKVGNFWYEFPGNIPFVESGRGGIYLHLIDHGRVKDGDPAHPFTLTENATARRYVPVELSQPLGVERFVHREAKNR